MSKTSNSTKSNAGTENLYKPKPSWYQAFIEYYNHPA